MGRVLPPLLEMIDEIAFRAMSIGDDVWTADSLPDLLLRLWSAFQVNHDSRPTHN